MPLQKSPRRKAIPSMTPVRLSRAPRHHLTKLPLAISIMAFLAIVAVMIGSLAASSMQRDDDMLRANIEQSQQRLLARLQRLEETCFTPRAAETQLISNALRVDVTAQQLTEMSASINQSDWNMDIPNDTREYKDLQRDISARFPYNQKWGNTLYKITPFEIKENRIFFGPIAQQKDTRVFYRKFSLTILPVNATIPGEKTRRIKQLSGFPLTVIQKIDGTGALRFEGKKYTYLLTETQETVKDLETAYQEVPMNDAQALAILRSLRSI